MKSLIDLYITPFIRYIVVVVVAVVLGIILWQHDTILGLKLDLSNLQLKESQFEDSANTCKDLATRQNKTIIDIQKDDNESKAKLAEWKALPPEIRYQTIYKYKTLEVKSDDCKDIKPALDDIRNTSF